MNIIFGRDDLSNCLNRAAAVSRDHPVVFAKYIKQAKEIEVNAVAKNGELVMRCVSEHAENAVVYSGDVTSMHPPRDLDPETVRRIRRRRLGTRRSLLGHSVSRGSRVAYLRHADMNWITGTCQFPLRAVIWLY
jgi:carbamoyl-phosphate synthase/aspartate carbamoyltransferase